MSLLGEFLCLIEIKLKEYGLNLVEVVDNGTGVEEQNFQGLSKYLKIMSRPLTCFCKYLFTCKNWIEKRKLLLAHSFIYLNVRSCCTAVILRGDAWRAQSALAHLKGATGWKMWDGGDPGNYWNILFVIESLSFGII